MGNNKILIVLGKYIGETAPNGLCMKNIVNVLEEMDCDVDVICIEETEAIPEVEKVFPVIRNVNRGNISKFLRKVIKTMHIPVEDYKLVKILRKEVENRLDQKKYDMLISVVKPTETAEAVFALKKKYPEVKFVLYEIDPASNRYKVCTNFIEKLWRKCSTKWENKVYASYDWIIHMKTHKSHFDTEVYKEFYEKTAYFDISNFVKNDVFFEEISISKPVKFIYAGAFYPDIRNPKIMFDTLCKLSKEREIKLDVYTGTTMKSVLNRYAEENDFIVIHDEIPQKQIINEIYKSDVLLSLGNLHSDFLPSKIFTYMSTGKPILHFCGDSEDTSKQYLLKYPRALVIDQNADVEDNIEKIIAFFKECEGGHMDENKIFEILEENTPEYTAQKFIDLVE